MNLIKNQIKIVVCRHKLKFNTKFELNFNFKSKLQSLKKKYFPQSVKIKLKL